MIGQVLSLGRPRFLLSSSSSALAPVSDGIRSLPAPMIEVVGADLTGAVLTDADLRSANLTNAILTSATLTNAIWSFTTCPNGVVQSTPCA